MLNLVVSKETARLERVKGYLLPPPPSALQPEKDYRGKTRSVQLDIRARPFNP